MILNKCNTLKKNVLNVWSDKGAAWLDQLPDTIEQLMDLWQLSDLTPVDNMSYNYVGFVTTQDKKPAVLKFSCDKALIEDEYKALKHFNGKGAIDVIAHNEQGNALLLERAVPGTLLKDHKNICIDETIQIYADVIKCLANHKNSDLNDFVHMSHWCKAIDRIKPGDIESVYVNKANDLRKHLLNTATHEFVCHGDLHLENILLHGNDWVIIDPKGIIGEIAFEAAAFDLLSDDEINQAHDIAQLLKQRIERLSVALDIDYQRLLSWVYLRTMISAQWFIEDNGDPSKMINLMKQLYLLISRAD